MQRTCPITGTRLLWPNQTVDETTILGLRQRVEELPSILTACEWALGHPPALGIRSAPAESKPTIAVGLLDLIDEQRDIIDTWAAEIAAWRAQPYRPGDMQRAVALFLIEPKNTGGQMHQPLWPHPQALDMIPQVKAAVDGLERILDQRPALIFAGRCEECSAELITPDSSYVQCSCGHWVDVQKAQAKMRAQVENIRAPRHQARRMASALLGKEISPNTFKSWIRRGHLKEVGGKVRVGDAIKPAPM